MIRLSAGTWLWKCVLGCLAGRSALATVVNPTCELCHFVDKLSYMLFDLCSPYLYDLFQFMCNIPCVFFFSLPLRTVLHCVCSGWQSCRCYEYVQSNSSHLTIILLVYYLSAGCSSRADADNGPPRYVNIYVPPRPCLRENR
jgi:hypothetical protein